MHWSYFKVGIFLFQINNALFCYFHMHTFGWHDCVIVTVWAFTSSTHLNSYNNKKITMLDSFNTSCVFLTRFCVLSLHNTLFGIRILSTARLISVVSLLLTDKTEPLLLSLVSVHYQLLFVRFSIKYTHLFYYFLS